MLFLNLSFGLYAQTETPATIEIKAQDTQEPLPYALVYDSKTLQEWKPDREGKVLIFSNGKTNIQLTIRMLGFQDQAIKIDFQQSKKYTVFLLKESHDVAEVQVNAKKEQNELGLTKLDPKTALVLPSTFGDFNKILATLPGVVSNNELSSTYAVRGGNYDENLVFVNGIEVYRPFLVSQGQQEGLSFINPSLVKDISFYAGGWPSKYGDKLSSVLDVQYKTPKKWAGSVQASLLVAGAHVEGVSKNGKSNFILGYRYKSARYLLNTLPVQGQYLPLFHDVQGMHQFILPTKPKLGTPQKRTTLDLLWNFAFNKYEVRPQNQESTFGTNTQTLRLFMAFEGKETMRYQTLQSGLKLTHWYHSKYKTEWLAGYMRSAEREFYDVEAGYRLCEVFAVPGTPEFEQCANQIGIGTQFRYGRNLLDAQVIQLENRNQLFFTPTSTFEWGVKTQNELFQDQLNEYAFIDSADYVQIQYVRNAQHSVHTQRLNGYIQWKKQLDSTLLVTLGGRIGYAGLNKELWASPTVQLHYTPKWRKNTVFKLGAGIYRQPPFYREMRNVAGQLNPGLRAQNSLQVNAGVDYLFELWNRPFKLTGDIYYKYLWNIIGYKVDNVRLRYDGLNNAMGFAYGADCRIAGEFIKGAESWFSIGYLKTMENLDADLLDFIRRPSDQRLTFAIFFQDHLLNNPSVKISLNLVYGTGLPFGPPENDQYRNAFTMPAYRRLDVGFSKLIAFHDKSFKSSVFESIWIGFEILNIIGANNTISYNWVNDVSNRQFAVPNTLSQRFYNVKLVCQF